MQRVYLDMIFGHFLGVKFTYRFFGFNLSPVKYGSGSEKNGNVCMTHKAFNGRVIVEFLAEACEMVVSRQLPHGDNRIFGQWLTEKIAQGNCEWPYPLDAEFGLATTCLLLDLYI